MRCFLLARWFPGATLSLLALLPCPAHAATQTLLDLRAPSIEDNLWDGIGSGNELRVFTLNQGILVDGSAERRLPFGA
ncbi:hypothetical protein GX586_01870, partial [bacterium]|nr:hypothetical protein [bacterium]